MFECRYFSFVLLVYSFYEYNLTIHTLSLIDPSISIVLACIQRLRTDTLTFVVKTQFYPRALALQTEER